MGALRSAMPERSRTATVAAPIEEADLQTAYVVRFDVHQRIQHILMIASFVTLVVTGFPQKFTSLEISQWLMDVMGGIENMRLVHRIAGGVMIFDGIYHISYIAYTVLILGKTGPLQMIPNLKDAEDAIQTTFYFLGITREKPRYGRFSYLEKFDYWAVFWGMAIMGGSGLILLFPVQYSLVAPGQGVIAALRAHSDEALLAVTWITVVHLFYAHLTPRIFPFNPSIFTGRVPASRYLEEHPLEFEKLLDSGLVQGIREKPDEPAPSDPSGSAGEDPADRDDSGRESHNPEDPPGSPAEEPSQTDDQEDTASE